jgi:hypothetical protein
MLSLDGVLMPRTISYSMDTVIGVSGSMIFGKSALLSIVIAGVLAVGIYAPIAIMGSQNSSTTTTTTCTSSKISTTTVTVTTVSSNTTAGSFTYSPSSPVQVQSVEAMATRGSNGQILVTFAVNFKNVGDSPIYVAGGCGSGLSSSIADSSVIKKVAGGPLCACAMFIQQLQHGQNHTSVNPGCWSGYHYELVGSGTVTVNFTQNWSVGGYNFQNQNSTSIVATFHFA